MMRRITFTFSLVLVAGLLSSLFAQEAEDQEKAPEMREFYIGVTGMPMVTQFWTPEPDLGASTEVSKNIGLGYSAGIYLGEFFCRNWGFEVGANFSRFTDDADFTTTVTDSAIGQALVFERNERQEVSYVTVPLLARYRSNPEKAFQFSAVGGLQIGVLSGLNYYLDDALLPDTVRNEFDARMDQYASASLSVQLGAGFSYNFLDNWRIDVRGQGGMSVFDIEDIKLKDGTDRGATRAINGGLFVGLCYRIPKKNGS